MNDKPLTCPMCQHTEQTQLFTSWNGYPIVRCVKCALAFTDDRNAPSPDTLYPAFSQSDTFVQKQVRNALSVFLRQREAFVRKVTPRRDGLPRLLDFGCGSGAFARRMSEVGYDAVGIEPFSLGAPTHDRNLLLVREPLETAKGHLGKFDVITLWHVLEHVKNPVEIMSALQSMLTEGGTIVVSVPNFESMQSVLFKESWFHLDPPRHLLHFERQTLEECLSRAGLAVADEKKFLPEYGTSGWVQSALNFTLPHKNFLFEFAKDRGALRDMPAKTSAAHLAASFAFGAPVFAASLPIEALASARSQGAALTLAARRR